MGMWCCTHRIGRASPILGGEVPGLCKSKGQCLCLQRHRAKQRANSMQQHRTRRMTTFTNRLLSLRPSGLAGSPLAGIGLALRLLVVELVLEVLEKPDFRRLGMMRTMAGGAGSTGGRFIMCYQLPSRFPSFSTKGGGGVGRPADHIRCLQHRSTADGWGSSKQLSQVVYCVLLCMDSHQQQRFALPRLHARSARQNRRASFDRRAVSSKWTGFWASATRQAPGHRCWSREWERRRTSSKPAAETRPGEADILNGGSRIGLGSR